MSKIFMKTPTPSFFGCVVAAINPEGWAVATAEQREIWAENCMAWCHIACQITETTFEATQIAAISDLFDVDIAIECLVTAQKWIYKATEMDVHIEGEPKQHRPRAEIQVG